MSAQKNEQPKRTSELHRSVPFSNYLSWPLWSQSVIKQGRIHNGGSMKAVKCAFDRDFITPPTDAMSLGSALHIAFLEPEQYDERVVLWDGPRRAGKEWEAFKEEHSGKIILTQGYYENMLGMVESLRAQPELMKWCGHAEGLELSIKGELYGLPFKMRADVFDDAVIDIKSISACDDRTVNNAIFTFGYHIQENIYTGLSGRERFILALVESAAPYDSRLIELTLSEDWKRAGRIECKQLTDDINRCIETDRWPGISSTLDTIEPDEWMMQRLGLGGEQITMGGEKVF